MTVVDDVKSRLDIVEVISSYVPLQKSGRNHKGLCPFHSEKTASFVVFPDNQRWHCFGACSEGGDVFSFVMKREGWDFRTALEELARRAGVELRDRTPAQIQEGKVRDRHLALLDSAAQYYNHLLRHSAEAGVARRYIAERGLSDETIATFLLGYSLPGWDNARAYLTEQGYSIGDLVGTGLLVERDDASGTYDRFRDRLMIPIHDLRGRVIGFGARTLDPDGLPKYINSPQTDLFDKSRTVFGLDLARRTIREKDCAVIVEGYMDVMQANQAGFANVVAQMGTALTEWQLRQLQRYTKRLVLALDPDAAGVRATLRGVEVAQKTLDKEWEHVFDPQGLMRHESRIGAEIRVLRLPSGHDPDDLIRQKPELWATLVETAESVVDFYLGILMEEVDLDDTKAKARVVDRLLPVIRAVANPVERDDYVQKTARALQVDPRSIRSRLSNTQRPTGRRSQFAASGGHEEPRPSTTGTESERYCVMILLQRPGFLGQINEVLRESQLGPLSEEDFDDTGIRAVFGAWQDTLATQAPTPIETLRARLPEGLHELLNSLLPNGPTPFAEEQLVRDATLTVLRLRERALKRLGQELNFATADAQETGDAIAKQHIQAASQDQTQRLLRTWQAMRRPVSVTPVVSKSP